MAKRTPEIISKLRRKRIEKKAKKIERKRLEKFYSDRMMSERGLKAVNHKETVLNTTLQRRYYEGKMMKRFYEASQFRKDGVRPEAPTQANHYPADLLRDQARFLYENDTTSRRAIDLVVANIIGQGVMPIFQGSPAIKDIIQREFDRWSNTTESDYDSMHTFSGLQSLVVRTTVRDGACFILKNFVKKTLKLQVLEPEYLNVHVNRVRLDNGGEIRNGIEYDASGQRKGYYFYVRHPDDPGPGASFEVIDPRSTSVTMSGGRQTVRIPAKRVAHVFRLDRANQQDGFSWIGSCLSKLWDLREYEEAKLIQQKIQCSFTAFIEDNYSLSEEEREDFLGDAQENSMNRTVAPGSIEELPTGKTVKFPVQAVTPHEEFVERTIRSVAAAMGLSYEAFNDYSKVNFSSGRMGFIEMDRHMKNMSQTVFIPRFFNQVAEWFFDHLIYREILPLDHGLSIKWVLPQREMIDPEKETRTLLSLWGANVISAKYVQARLGLDFDKNMREIIETKKLYSDLGLEEVGLGASGPTTDPKITDPEVAAGGGGFY